MVPADSPNALADADSDDGGDDDGDDEVEEASEESFPASDAPASWSGPPES